MKYYITGVWKNSNGVITYVMLHTPAATGGVLNKGNKTSVGGVIELLKHNEVYSARWGYPTWLQGAKVIVVGSGSFAYIRTVADSTEKDNLDNLIPMEAFFN
jgi:hypothetical protein